MFLITVVLLFLLKIRFPKNRPISNILKERYGVPLLQKFRSLEKTTKKLDKAKCDDEFLQSCLAYNVIPRFLRIKLYRRSLETSSLCKSWQMKMLRKEISSKQRTINEIQSKIDSLLNDIKSVMSPIDFSCMKLWIHRKQRNFIESTKLIHEKKLKNLGISLIKCRLSPQKKLSIIYQAEL